MKNLKEAIDKAKKAEALIGGYTMPDADVSALKKILSRNELGGVCLVLGMWVKEAGDESSAEVAELLMKASDIARRSDITLFA